MLVKNSKGPWELKELMELQELLPDDQLLIVKVKPSDHLYHFFFVGPPAESVIVLLKDSDRFHGVKEPIRFSRDIVFLCAVVNYVNFCQENQVVLKTIFL